MFVWMTDALSNACSSTNQVRGSYGLIECMERYISSEGKEGSTFVVMGSLQMTSNVLDSVAVSTRHRGINETMEMRV